MQIASKKIILTGASSGIGAELLRYLRSYKDVQIIAVARNIKTIPSTEGIVFPFSTDLSNPEGVDSLFDYSNTIFGEADIFIANAGFGYCETISKADWNHIDAIYRLNVFSPIYSLERFMQGTKKKKIFVPIISGAALTPFPNYSLYASTKAALHHFLQGFKYECPSNIKILSVYPVAVRTPFFEKATSNLNTIVPYPSQSADVVARSIIKGIEKETKKIYPFPLFPVLYLVTRIFPSIFNLYTYWFKKKSRL